jgi:hypothetical protein
MESQSGASTDFFSVVWRNHAVTELINANFPGEWERDLAYMALALVSKLDPRIAELLGAELEA